MARKLAATLPKDQNGATVMVTPDRVALATTVDSTISTTTQVNLNAATTMIRVYAVSQDICLKWGTSAATSTSFDEIIPANQICDFVIPADITAVNFIERTASATLICIEK